MLLLDDLLIFDFAIYFTFRIGTETLTELGTVSDKPGLGNEKGNSYS